LEEVRKAQCHLRITVDDPGKVPLPSEYFRERYGYGEWTGALVALLITEGPSNLNWLEELAGSGASAGVAEAGSRLPWPRGLCPRCKLSVLVWEVEPRCPLCGFTNEA
jgi:hypothetical protein